MHIWHGGGGGREKRQIKLPEPVKIWIRWRRLLTDLHKQTPPVYSPQLRLLVRPSARRGRVVGGPRNACQARPRFIGVHISLTSGCQGLLLHRYFTGSGYLHHHPIPPDGKKEKKKNVGGGNPCKWGSAWSLPSAASHLAPIKECWGPNKSLSMA